MATYYVPGEAGWNDTGGLGSAARLRLKLEQSYDAAANRSTLTITMQGCAPNYGGPFYLINNALVRLNGSTLYSGGNGNAALRYYIRFSGDDAWHDLTDDDTGQTESWTATLDHAPDGTATAALSVTARLFFSDSYYFTFYNLSGSQALTGNPQFTLSLSAGNGCSITVLRDGAALANGAALSGGDVLTISFAAQEGYRLTAHTVNGVSFTSGGTLTVTGDVFVSAAAVRKTYTLSISYGAGTSIAVLRDETALENGATITHGDALTVSFAPKPGFELLTHTVNGASFPSGGIFTVTGNVRIAATARRIGVLRLDTGGELRRYRLLMDTGSAIVPARIFLDRGDRITEAGI